MSPPTCETQYHKLDELVVFNPRRKQSVEVGRKEQEKHEEGNKKCGIGRMMKM